MKSCLLAWVLGRILAWSRLVLHYLQRERFVAFLKFSKTKYFARFREDLCGIALEIVQLRIALNLETRALAFKPWAHSERSTVNYNVRPVWPDSKQPSNKRLGKSGQEDQISPKEARGVAMTESPTNHCNSRSPRHREASTSKTIWHGLATLLPFERLAGPKTWKGDPGKS